MVDPVNLVLLQRVQDLGVECLGRGEVVAKRFFDHHAPPLPVAFLGEAGRREPGDGRAEEAVRDGEIEQMVARGAGRLVEPGQMRAQPLVSRGIVEIALHIAHALGQPRPRILIEAAEFELAILADKFPDLIGERLAPRFDGLIGEVDTDDPESVRQPAGGHQIVERRHDQAFGQVAGGTEDHHGAWRRHHSSLALRAFSLGRPPV